jgi:tetratricopeptide (TPR) repeat protein
LWVCADVEGAVAEFRIAMHLKPDWSVPLWSLGNIYECEFEEFDSARSFFERALKVDPEDEEALTSLGRLFKKRGRVDLAKKYLSRALRLDPLNKKARALLSEMESDGAA